MTTKTKKIIAREGLIILVISLATYILEFYLSVVGRYYITWDSLGVCFLIVYVPYLIVRFIIWAIKILKNK